MPEGLPDIIFVAINVVPVARQLNDGTALLINGTPHCYMPRGSVACLRRQLRYPGNKRKVWFNLLTIEFLN